MEITIPRGDGNTDQDVEEAIELTRLCQMLDCLPSAGGLLDQDAYHVWLMTQVVKADQAKAERDRSKH